MRKITILALPQSLGSSITLPLEMLNAAHSLFRAKQRHEQALQICIASIDNQPFKTSGGLQIHTDCHFEDIEQTDLLILPALWRNPLNQLKQFPELLPWLQKMAQQGSWICAVGTSCCFLAEAGLLNNKPATTHWYYLEKLAKRYPKVDWKNQYLITQADNIYCAGSVNSVADLMVHLVGRVYGQHIAHAVEAQFSPEIRRPFENHAYSQSDTTIHGDEVVIEVQTWLRENSCETIAIKEVAKKFSLSCRSLNRRFKQAVGMTPSDYLQQQRLDIARELLRTSNLSIAEVAAQVGYQDSSYFCARFKQWQGKTPLAYRKTVRGKLFQLT